MCKTLEFAYHLGSVNPTVYYVDGFAGAGVADLQTEGTDRSSHYLAHRRDCEEGGSSEFLDLRDHAESAVFSRPSTSRPPTSAALSTSAGLGENVHASQVKMPRGLQHVAVVRVDLLKAMLLGAGQVQRVTGSEGDRAR